MVQKIVQGSNGPVHILSYADINPFLIPLQPWNKNKF